MEMRRQPNVQTLNDRQLYSYIVYSIYKFVRCIYSSGSKQFIENLNLFTEFHVVRITAR